MHKLAYPSQGFCRKPVNHLEQGRYTFQARRSRAFWFLCDLLIRAQLSGSGTNLFCGGFSLVRDLGFQLGFRFFALPGRYLSLASHSLSLARWLEDYLLKIDWMEPRTMALEKLGF